MDTNQNGNRLNLVRGTSRTTRKGHFLFRVVRVFRGRRIRTTMPKSFYYAEEFCQAAQISRSAAVLGRRNTRPSGGLQSAKGQPPSYLAAPGDGRTPFGCGSAALCPFVSIRGCLKDLLPLAR